MFWVEKLTVVCSGWLDLSRDFLGDIQNNLKIRGSAPQIKHSQT